MENGMERTKKTVLHIFNQAKESLKSLEIFEKDAVAKALELIKIPNSSERKRLTNDRILNSLKKLGVATQAEVEALELKLKTLESGLSLKSDHKE